MADEMEVVRARIRACVESNLDARVTRFEPLASALGVRRFVRVWIEATSDSRLPRTLIARVETPEDPQRRPSGVAPEPPLEPIRALLERHGLPVPRSYGIDTGAGIDLLGDFGDRSLASVAAGWSATERDALYREACALVPKIQSIEPTPGVAAFERRLDAAQIDYKAQRFARWSLCGADSAATQVVRDAFALIADEIARAPRRLAHRDFQSANLYLIDTGKAPVPPALHCSGRIAMIDLQGAFMAPPEYDLMCLLRDSYVELPESSVQTAIEAVREQLPDAPDAETFAHRFDLLTLARKGKDHALYRYAAVELGDSRYLKFRPRAQRALRAAAARVAQRDPRFAALADRIASLPEAQADSPCEP